MNENWIASIVEILDKNRFSVGTGFFVNSTTIVTCAHVVEKAVSGPGESIEFRVNLKNKETIYTAFVDIKSWRDPMLEDVAVLKFDTVVEGAKSSSLGELIGTKGFSFQTYGFPSEQNEQSSIGTWAEGTISGKVFIENVEFFQANSQTITTGFSGAPIWDSRSDMVVGMVSSIRTPDSFGRLGQVTYIIPASVIAEVYPSIEISKLFNLPASCYTEYELLNKETLSSRRIYETTFYLGSEPTWNDIVADRDIERDVFPIIIELAEKNYGRTTFILFSGQPGTGKSTLLKRIGYALHKEGHAVLFHHKGSDVLQINTLRAAYDAIQCPIYILVDDIFRKQNAQGFLSDLSNLDIPLFLIATSRSNELEETRLSLRSFTDATEFELNALSVNESERLIHKLAEQGAIKVGGKDSVAVLKKIIEKESQLLVILTRLVAGKDSDFETILWNELRGLEGGPMGPLLYEAYTYVCALYSIGVAMPVTLLQRLISTRDIYRNVLNRPEVKGLIERTDNKKVRARHEYIAERIMRQVWTEPDQIDELYISIIQECNPEDSEERGVILLLLSSLLSHGMKASAKRISLRISSTIFDTILPKDNAETIIKGWGRYFRQLGDALEQEKFFQIALSQLPDEYRIHLEYGLFLENLGRMDEAESHLELAMQKENDTFFSANSFAAFLIRQKRFSETQAILDDTLRASPGNKYILSTYALLLKEQGLFEAAETYYKAAVDSDPEDIYARTTYAKFLWPLGRTEEALHYLERGLEKNVLAVNTLHIFSRYCREVRQTGRAIKIVQQACDEYPQNKLTRQLLINLLTEENLVDQAIEQCQIGLLLFPNEAWFKRQYVDLLLRESLFDGAATQLMEYVQICDAALDDYLLLAKLSSQLRQDVWVNTCLDEIAKFLRINLEGYRASNTFPIPLPLVEVDITYLHNFFKRNTDDIVSRLLYIQSLIVQVNTEMLEELFLHSSTNPADIEVLTQVRLAYIYGAGNLAAYEDGLSEAKQTYPDKIWPVRGLVDLLDRLERQSDANSLLQESIRKFPNELWLYTARLKILGRLGDQSELDSHVDLISRVFPDYLPGKMIYVDKLIREESYEEAERILNDVISDRPRDSSVRHKYVALLLETNRLDLAEKQLTELLYLNPSDVGGRLTLVNLLRANSREKEADTHIQFLQSVNIGPTSMYTALSSWGVKQNTGGKETLLKQLMYQPTATSILSQYVRLLEAEGNLEVAQAQIEQSLAVVTPPRSSLRRLYAECLVRWEKPEDAEAQLKFALDEHPNKPMNYVSYARFLDKSGRQDEAKAIIKKAQDNQAINWSPRWLTIMAGMAYKSGNMTNARDYYWLAQMVDDNDPVSHFTFANFLEETGETEAARQHYKRAVALNPAYVNANQAYAVFLSNHSSDMNTVVDQFESTLALDRKNVPVLCAYADFLFNKKPIKGWRKKTEELLEAAISYDPDHFQSRLLYALHLKQEKKFEQAELQFIHAIEKNEQAYAARQAYAVFLKSQQRFAEAQAQFMAAFDARENLVASRLHNAMVHNALADLFVKTRQPEETIVGEYEAALNIEPYNMQSRFHLVLVHKDYAEFLCRQDKVEQAKEHFETALKLQPDNSYVINSYARCLTSHNLLDAAIDLYKMALNREPYQEHALGGITKVLCQLGRYEEADQYFNLSLEKHPNNTHILITYIKSLLDRNRNMEAEKALRHLESLDPSNRDLKNLRSQLSLRPKAPQNSAREMQNQALEQKNSGNYDRARELFRSATEKDSGTGWQPWALMEKELGNIETARSLFQRMTQEKPMDPAGWQAWALLELDAGDFQKALTLAEKSVSLNPEDFYPYMARGRVYQLMGFELNAVQDLEFARQSLEQQLLKKTDSTKLLNLLGRVLIWLKEYDKAEDVLRSSLALAPEKEKHFALNGLGELFEAKGSIDEAVAFWKNALSYQRYNLVVRNHLLDQDVDVEQIILEQFPDISTLGDELSVEPEFPAGTVTKINLERKFGFITDKDGKEYYFRVQSVDSPNALQDDVPVDFDITETDRGLQAINVIVKEKICHTGEVKSFNQERGYGFIAMPGGWQVFFHISNVINPDAFSEQAQVSFFVVNTRKGRQAREVNVQNSTILD